MPSKLSEPVPSLFPILNGENNSDVVLDNVTPDGNKAHNDNLDGNYAGCVISGSPLAARIDRDFQRETRRPSCQFLMRSHQELAQSLGSIDAAL